jgi:hypothetical protein
LDRLFRCAGSFPLLPQELIYRVIGHGYGDPSDPKLPLVEPVLIEELQQLECFVCERDSDRGPAESPGGPIISAIVAELVIDPDGPVVQEGALAIAEEWDWNS